MKIIALITVFAVLGACSSHPDVAPRPNDNDGVTRTCSGAEDEPMICICTNGSEATACPAE